MATNILIGLNLFFFLEISPYHSSTTNFPMRALKMYTHTCVCMCSNLKYSSTKSGDDARARRSKRLIALSSDAVGAFIIN